MKQKVGVVGGRGVVGQELMTLLGAHPGVDVVFGAAERRTPADVAALDLDVLFLCAPNGVGAAYVAALDASASRRPPPLVVDLSSDHRFVGHAPASGGGARTDGAPASVNAVRTEIEAGTPWVYGLPERTRERVRGARLIANPGCYATAAQLALDPFLDVIAGVPAVFGVSGYSGAGATPSPKNDPAHLADNIVPYDLVDHTQEREIARHLGVPVAFMPHVAPFFVGITLTIAVSLARSLDAAALRERARARYAGERLVRVVDTIPEVRDARGTHVVTIGGFAAAPSFSPTSSSPSQASPAHGPRAVIVATIDNLLKGAATQAVQNMNIALGLDELAGIAVQE